MKALGIGWVVWLSLTAVVFAETIDLDQYHLSVKGRYDRLRLEPKNLSDGLCDPGQIAIDLTQTFHYCGTINSWKAVGGPWVQDGDKTYVTGLVNLAAVKLRLSTAPAEFTLTLNEDGGILVGGNGTGPGVLPVLSADAYLWWSVVQGSFYVGYQHDLSSRGDFVTVLGGGGNKAYGLDVLLGGDGNASLSLPELAVTETLNVIGGGKGQQMSGSRFSFSAGGEDNGINQTDYGVLLGGNANQITQHSFGTIIAGKGNQISTTGSEHYSFILGGLQNQIFSTNSWILGGINNVTRSPRAFIAGGENNIIEPYCSGLIFGGKGNVSFGRKSVVFGGRYNQVTTDGAIYGGENNVVEGDFMAGLIVGGRNNRILASGKQAYILGGSDNVVEKGQLSVVGGRNIHMNLADLGGGDYFAFAWGYSDTPVTITRPYTVTFLVKRFGVEVLNPQYPLHFASGAHIKEDGNVCTAAGTCLDDISDRRLKTDIRPLRNILPKVLKLRPVTFFWKPHTGYALPTDQRQIGLVAQEVEKVFPQWVSVNARGHKVLTMKGVEAVIVQAMKELDEQMRETFSSYEQDLQKTEEWLKRFEEQEEDQTF